MITLDSVTPPIPLPPPTLRTSPDDRELHKILARARGGDTDALGALYDIYRPAIYRFLHLRTGNPDVAEDLTSGVFLKVVEAIQSRRAWDDSFTGWLYRITRNQLIDYGRRGSRRPQSELLDTAPCPVAADMEENAIRHCTYDDVRAAFDDLRPSYAAVLSHRYAEGLSHAEVGRLIGKNEDSVKMTHSRAMKSLRQKLVPHATVAAPLAIL